MKKIISYSSALLVLAACGKPVTSTKVIRKDISELVFASGTLEAEDSYQLTAQTDGYLKEIRFSEGDLVKSGDLLAVIDNAQNNISARSAQQIHALSEQNTRADGPALKQLEANLKAARDKYQQDKQQLDRYTRLREQEAVSQLEFENIRLAANTSEANVQSLEAQYRNLKLMNAQAELQQRAQMEIGGSQQSWNEIRVLVPGKVYEKRKQAGDFVRRGEVIAVIGNPGVMYARLNVDESSMAKIKQGQQVYVRLNTDKNTALRATVSEILPAFDKATQSFIVEAKFTDQLPFNLSGTQLEANILIGKHDQVLLVPRHYLGYGNAVLINEKESIKVETGVISNDWVEIRSGLKEGQTIYTDKIQ